jgi:hypothetical protein
VRPHSGILLDRDNMIPPVPLYNPNEKQSPIMFNLVPSGQIGAGIGIPNAIQPNQPTTTIQGNVSLAPRRGDNSLENQFGRLSVISNESNFSIGSGASNLEQLPRDFSDNVPIEEFISELATFYNRGIEKATEWLRILKGEDIDSVGDLRGLQEDDWAKLNLTVFACRAMKNALKSRTVGSTLLASLSPRVTGRATSDENN